MTRPIIALLTACIMLGAPAARAVDVAGVEIPKSVEISDGASRLTLNGAGVREKFFIDIYVGALYLPQTEREAKAVLTSDTANSMRMHVVYGEITPERLAAGFDAGFEANHSARELEQLAERIVRFNERWPTLHAGDIVKLDYIPGRGTRIRVNAETLDTIPGADFNSALLAVWLGESPADASLKRALLGR